MTALLDTGFLLAVIDADDAAHDACSQALNAELSPMLPVVVLPELAYMILREMGYKPLIHFMKAIEEGELELLPLGHQDLSRAREIIEKYDDSKVDFVDCCIAAMAERLNIIRILTVDRKHFSIFRPKHCDYFEIIPLNR